MALSPAPEKQRGQGPVCPDRAKSRIATRNGTPKPPNLQYSINPTNESSLGEISGLAGAQLLENFVFERRAFEFQFLIS